MIQTTNKIEIDEELFEIAQLPDVKELTVTEQGAGDEDQKTIAALAEEIQTSDTNSIIFFGSKAQEKLTQLSDQMLEGVRT